MKKLLILFCLLLTAYTSFSQEKEARLSKADEFSKKSGILLQSEFIKIGTFKTVSVEVLKMKDLSSDQSNSSLRFEYVEKGTYTSDTRISTIDFDEISGLLSSIEKIQTKVITVTPPTYTEVMFISRTGFEFGVYYEETKASWFGLMKIGRLVKSSVYFHVEELSTIKSLIEQAKLKI